MKNDSIRTSDTHPIRIDSIPGQEGWGAIGMSFCPGKTQVEARTGQWQRDLYKDMDRIHNWGARVVVSLVEAHEFQELAVPTLPEEVERRGMKWRHLPIRDMHAPGVRFREVWPELGRELLTTLAAGQSIFLHCKGGLGRTGIVAACLLIECGLVPEEAIARVRGARRNTIETEQQEWFVMTYKPVLA